MNKPSPDLGPRSAAASVPRSPAPAKTSAKAPGKTPGQTPDKTSAKPPAQSPPKAAAPAAKMPAQPPAQSQTQSQTLPPGSLKAFEQLIANDLGNPALAAAIPARRAPPANAPDRLGLRLGTVASRYLNFCLDQTTCALSRLRSGTAPDDWAQALGALDMVLIEVCWSYQEGAWAPLMREPAALSRADSPLAGLLAACRAQGVPVAFWFTADRTSLDIFGHLHGAADASFAADPAVAGALEAELCLPAICPALHNPLVDDPQGQQFVARNFALASDSYNELCGFDSASPVPGLLEPALDYLFWIFETRFLMRNNNARLAKDFRRRFVGCLTDADRALILKHSEIYLSAVPRPEIAQPDKIRNILEAMAAKTAVVTNMAPVIEALAPFVHRAENPEAVRAALQGLTQDPHLHRSLTHLAYREVMTRHSYADRLAQMGRSLGLPPGKTAKPPQPSVTALVPTMRPELLPFVLEGYRRHAYDPLDLVIVLHSDSYSPSDIAPMLRDSDRAQVIRVPESQSVGMALNVGIDAAGGDYWARIDDDDYYGPNYFGDAMLNRQFCDFDICGKSQWFIYFEALKGAFVHKRNWAAHSTNPVIAGGTFLVRNSGEARLRFDDRVRGYADIDLLGRAIDAGGTNVVSSDPFNFLQIRRMDRKSHTWTADTHQIKRTEQITQGMDLARIAI